MGSKAPHAESELAPQLDVEQQLVPGGLVFSVSGELDASNAEVMREVLLWTLRVRRPLRGSTRSFATPCPPSTPVT
jgi:hypothetical protein